MRHPSMFEPGSGMDQRRRPAGPYAGQERRKTPYEIKQQQRATAAQALQAQHPQLLPGQPAKNIRTELKAAFPGVKFSVRYRSFSGGDAIDVRWTDGPTGAQVDAIIQKYSAGHFDGMVDCYEYRHDAWTHAFGSAKFIHGSREVSDGLVARAVTELAIEYHEDAYDIHDDQGQAWVAQMVADFRRGNLWNRSPLSGAEGSRHWSWESLIHRKLAELVGGAS